MELTTIRELFKNREEYLDKQVTVGGWIRSIRDSKTFGFIVLNDGSYFETLQVVYHDKMENFAEISKLNVGAAVVVKGTLVATPQAKQPFEIQADEVVVEGASAPDYPNHQKKIFSVLHIKILFQKIFSKQFRFASEFSPLGEEVIALDKIDYSNSRKEKTKMKKGMIHISIRAPTVMYLL